MAERGVAVDPLNSYRWVQKFTPIAVLVLLTSLLALLSIWQVMEAAWLRSHGRETPGEVPLFLLVSIETLALTKLYVGFDTTLNIGLARRAAELLLGAGL